MGESFFDNLWIVGSILGIVFVLILTYYGSRWLVKRVSGATNGRNIQILDRAFLGQDKYVAIIKVGNKQLLVGVTPQRISKLCDIEESDGVVSPAEIKSNDVNFQDLLQNSIGNLMGKHRRKQDLENIDE